MTITITGLPLQSTIQDTTLIPVETAGITGHITALSIQSYLAGATLTAVTAGTGTFTTGTISGSLTVGSISAGSITSAGNIIAQANVIISGYEQVTGNVTSANLITGSIWASGNTYITGNVSAANATVSNNLTVYGNESLTGNLTISTGSVLFSSATLLATGSSQGTAAQITADNSFVTGGSGGVILPAATTGREVSITNTSGVSINVYPATGHLIETSAQNIPTVLPNNATLGLIAKSGNNWWSTQPIYNAGSGINISQSANGAVTWSTTGVAASETLATVTARGASSTSNITLTGGLNINSIIPTSNASINIGSTSGWFATIYGTSTHAQYADLAERYEADAAYEPGTVLSFGTDTEVTISQTANDPRVAGVVSTDPAYLMNGGLQGPNVVSVALTGRVPCRVVGTIRRGDLIVTSSVPGVATANNNPAPGTIIGKALGNYNNTEIGVIEVVVGRI